MFGRSVAAKKARSVFFESRNSIDIYIEDTAPGYKKIFKSILSRTFSDQYLISDVFPLGGRRAVIDRWRNDKNPRGRPRIYIIDGDLFLLHGDMPRDKGLYTLPFYCIENILLCKDAVINLIDEESPTEDLLSLEGEMDFSNWINTNTEHLSELFIHYALTFKYLPEIQTVASGVSGFVSNNDGLVDGNKIFNKIQELSEKLIEKIGLEKYNAELTGVKNKVNNSQARINYISGKDYLLPLLLMRLRKISRTKTPNLNLKYRLSLSCSTEQINDIENFILN